MNIIRFQSARYALLLKMLELQMSGVLDFNDTMTYEYYEREMTCLDALSTGNYYFVASVFYDHEPKENPEDLSRHEFIRLDEEWTAFFEHFKKNSIGLYALPLTMDISVLDTDYHNPNIYWLGDISDEGFVFCGELLSIFVQQIENKKYYIGAPTTAEKIWAVQQEWIKKEEQEKQEEKETNQSEE